jgi:hypothetical protein
MKVELKKYHPHKGLSHETLAFTAEIWIDGQREGVAENQGCGGPTICHFDNRGVQAKFIEHVRSLPPVKSEYGPLPMDIDLFIGELCDAAEFAKKVQRAKTKAVLFRLVDDAPNTYWEMKIPKGWTREAVVEYIRKTHLTLSEIL